MKIYYSGCRVNGQFQDAPLRFAKIALDENDEREKQIAECVLRELAQHGWHGDGFGEPGFDTEYDFRVADREEYEDLLAVYKAAKKRAVREIKSLSRGQKG